MKKKLNNRGFLLVETVVVSVVVLSIFTMIYVNSTPMMEEYGHLTRYDDLDTVYTATVFRDMLLVEPKYETFLAEARTNGYKEVTDCNVFSTEQRALCTTLKQKLGIGSSNHVYISRWNLSNLVNNPTIPRGFLDYVHYLRKEDREEVVEMRLLVSREGTYTTYEVDDSNHVVTKNESITFYANIGL